MDTRKTIDPTQHLPRLPGAFWGLTEQMLASWRNLLELLRLEWTALKNSDLTPLAEIAEEKKRLAEAISESELRTVKIVDRILGTYGLAGGADRWKNLRWVINGRDLMQFETWFAAYRLCREESLAMNQRNQVWIRDQVDLLRELTGIIAGNTLRKPATYGPAGRQDKRSNAVRYQIEVA
jgi:hypothetical protein